MAILISGVVSLTLTPMLCSRLLKPIDHHEKHNVLLRSFEWTFNRLTQGYSWALLRTVKLPRLVLAITLGTFVLTAVMFQAIPKGFFPIEDIGQLNGSTVGPDDASFDAMVARQAVLAEILKRDPDVISVISTVGTMSPRSGPRAAFEHGPDLGRRPVDGIGQVGRVVGGVDERVGQIGRAHV